MPRRSKSTRVVVTGGAGFIGSHLCDALVARGHRVTCVDNLVGTRGSTRNVVQRDLAVDALATLRLVRAAARDGVRKIVHSSTGSVLGESGELPGPVSYYGASKLAAESYFRVVAGLSGLDHTILQELARLVALQWSWELTAREFREMHWRLREHAAGGAFGAACARQPSA